MVECLTGKKVLMKGNYAIANAAVLAGCQCYFGYPITPQSEIGEFMSGKMQELGRAYVSAESELAAINMTLGACSTGVKAMSSVDLTYKAFYLAHKYQNPTVLLADGLLGQMMEPVEFKPYPYPEIDNSSWCLTGARGRDARIIRSYAPLADKQCEFLDNLYKKYAEIEEKETEWEEIGTEDADVVLVSFGSTSRNVRTAAKMLRQKGIKAGTFRPITLFPFPNKRLQELAQTTKKFVVVEVNMGQMVNDVRLAVNGKVPVELVHKGVGTPPAPEEIAAKVEGLL